MVPVDRVLLPAARRGVRTAGHVVAAAADRGIVAVGDRIVAQGDRVVAGRRRRDVERAAFVVAPEFRNHGHRAPIDLVAGHRPRRQLRVCHRVGRHLVARHRAIPQLVHAHRAVCYAGSHRRHHRIAHRPERLVRHQPDEGGNAVRNPNAQIGVVILLKYGGIEFRAHAGQSGVAQEHGEQAVAHRHRDVRRGLQPARGGVVVAPIGREPVGAHQRKLEPGRAVVVAAVGGKAPLVAHHRGHLGGGGKRRGKQQNGKRRPFHFHGISLDSIPYGLCNRK